MNSITITTDTGTIKINDVAVRYRREPFQRSTDPDNPDQGRYLVGEEYNLHVAVQKFTDEEDGWGATAVVNTDLVGSSYMRTVAAALAAAAELSDCLNHDPQSLNVADYHGGISLNDALRNRLTQRGDVA